MPTRLRIDRTQLHEMVWSAPISTLARRFGLSDVGLAKLCKRFGVPIPSRGYWARVSAGRTPERRPLPPPERGEDRVVALEEFSHDEVVERAARRARFEETRKALRALPVTPETGALHRSVRRARAALSACERDYKGLRKSPPNELEVEVTDKHRKRVLSLADTVIRVFEGQGAEFRESADGSGFAIDGCFLRVAFTEHVACTSHQLTRAEKAARERYERSISRGFHGQSFPETPLFDWTPSGVITIRAWGQWGQRRWNDTGRSTLETRLGVVVTEAFELVATMIHKDREFQIESERRRIERERYLEAVALREREAADRRDLMRSARRWSIANRLRRYIDAVEEASKVAGTLDAKKRDWIAWARFKADRVDPLCQVSDVILDAPKPTHRYWCH